MHFIIIRERGYNAKQSSEEYRKERKSAIYCYDAEKQNAYRIRKSVKAINVRSGLQIFFTDVIEYAVLQYNGCN